jgi:Protein of unknown function (DUF2480)
MEIINKVSQSGLITFDLEDLYVPGDRVLFDLKEWLFEELILKEKDFRARLKEHDWEQYNGKFVAIICSADAIVPTWAFMLIASHLETHAKKITFGNLQKLEEEIFDEAISKLNQADFKDQKVIIKGCSKIDVPVSAYVKLTEILRPVVKSIMYGEPCSTVPVFKRKD